MNTSVSTTKNIMEAISKAVGKENVVTDPETLKKYSCDTSLLPPHMPDMVVKVKKTSEVQAVLKLQMKIIIRQSLAVPAQEAMVPVYLRREA